MSRRLLFLLFALASLPPTIGFYLAKRAQVAIAEQLRAADLLLSWSHPVWRGDHLELSDLRVYRRGQSATAAFLHLVPTRAGVELHFSRLRGLAALGTHTLTGEVQAATLRRAPCGWTLETVGGHLAVAYTTIEKQSEKAESTPQAEPKSLCRIEVRGLSLLPAGPESWPATQLDATWTPGLASLALHPAGGGTLALDLPPTLRPPWMSARLTELPIELATPYLTLPPHLSLAGTLSGEVHLTEDEAAEARLHWRGTLAHPALAAEPLNDIDLHLAATAHLESGPQLHLSRLRLRHGALDAHLTALLDATPGRMALQLAGQLTPISCEAAWHSLPAALRGPLTATRITGKLAPQLNFSVPLADPFALRLSLKGHDGCTVTALNLPPSAWPAAEVSGPRDDVDWLLRPFRRRVPEATREVYVGPATATYLPLSGLPRYVHEAAIVSEDPAFGPGHALDLGLIRRALMFNIERRRYVYGGSTIPQQLVKNLFLTREKSLARKLQEAVIAARLADRIPARRILELYLNCIEFAPNVYGIGPAARFYFAKPASALTPAEATFLAIAKPNPRYTAAMRHRGRTPDTPHFREYMRRILQRLVDRGVITALDLEAARPFQLHWTTGRPLEATK